MATITEDYVSFETAKLLKEKGFDEACFAFYYVMPHRINIVYDSNFPKNSDLCLIYANKEFGSLPTLQMAMKWLREVHNIHISIYPFNRELPITENTSYTCDVATKKDSSMRGHLRGTWKTYEEVVEAAIRYALENLI